MAYQIIYNVSLGVTKICLLLLYNRIFKVSRYHRVFILIGVYVILWSIAVLLVALLQCRPISYGWNKAQSGTCLDLAKVYIGIGATNVFGDILILISPVPIVWSLRIPRTRKLLISGLFLLGSS